MNDHHANSSRQQLTLENISKVDRGRVQLAFNHALRMATLDVLDRIGDKTARKVTLTVEMKPEVDKDSGALDCINNEFVISTAVPKKRTTSYPMLASDDGVQTFQPDAPFDPRQGTFNFGDERVDAGTGEVTGGAADDDANHH